jgi:hypothetical protein
VPKLRALLSAINPWSVTDVNAALQALYRPRYAAHFKELTGRKRTQDCPEDYLQGFRAIAMAQVIDIDVFEQREPRRFNADLHRMAAE